MELAIQNGRLVTGREGVVVVDVVIYIFLERFPSLLTDCLPATPLLLLLLLFLVL
jgi:hypothetical protein